MKACSFGLCQIKSLPMMSVFSLVKTKTLSSAIYQINGGTPATATMLLDTKTKEVSVWLAKLPPFLSKKLLSFNSDTEIGYLNISTATSDAPAQVSIGITLSDVPLNFTIRFNEISQPMYVLKGNDRIEGKVVKEVFVNPVFDNAYLEFKKMEEVSAAAQPSTQIIDYMKEGRKTDRFGTVSELESLARRRKKQLQSQKRERLERNEVMDMVFKAFEKFDSWTAKDLADFSGQPVAYIQEILGEIAVLNKKDHRNSYSLKPEYKEASDEDA